MSYCHIQAGYANNDFAYDFETAVSYFIRIFLRIIYIIIIVVVVVVVVTSAVAAAVVVVDDDDDDYSSAVVVNIRWLCSIQKKKLIETVFSLIKCVANQKNQHKITHVYTLQLGVGRLYIESTLVRQSELSFLSCCRRVDMAHVHGQ